MRRVPRDELPRLGFWSYAIHGEGEYVVDVERGSAAERGGLEPGDIVVELNHHPLNCRGEWSRRLAEAHAGTGEVTLSIRVARTGGIVSRRFSLPARGFPRC